MSEHRPGHLHARVDGSKVVVDIADALIQVSFELAEKLVDGEPAAGSTFSLGTPGEGLGVVSYELVGAWTGAGAPPGGCWLARKQD